MRADASPFDVVLNVSGLPVSTTKPVRDVQLQDKCAAFGNGRVTADEMQRVLDAMKPLVADRQSVLFVCNAGKNRSRMCFGVAHAMADAHHFHPTVANALVPETNADFRLIVETARASAVNRAEGHKTNGMDAVAEAVLALVRTWQP